MCGCRGRCNCNSRCEKGDKGDTGERGAQGPPGPNGVIPKIPILTPTFTTNNYTLVLTDEECELELSNGGTAGTLVIPLNSSVAFAIGTQILLRQTGTGAITVTAISGVTLQSRSSLVQFTGQYGMASLVKVAINTWALSGDLS